MASPALSSFGDTALLQQTPMHRTTKLTTIDLIGGIKCQICHLTFGNKKDFDSHYTNHTGSPNIIYTCVVCDKKITGYPSFRNHCYSIHVIKNRFLCKDCRKQFSKLSALQQHMDAVHKFVCTTCHQQFPTKKEMQMHQFTHKQERDSPPYDCQTCKQTIDTADTCEQHIEEHCTLTYACPICNETIPDKNNAVDHLTKHFGVVKEELISESDVGITEDSSVDLLGILCYICDNTYKTRIEFDMHFAEHHSGNHILYSCTICRKQYDKYHPFGNHCYFHYSKDRYECDECDKSFPRLSLLVLHTEAYHSAGAVAKPYLCPQCDCAYATDKRLAVHMREKHGGQCVECTEQGCGKLFYTPKELLYHQAVHKSARRCQQCGLQFTSLAACERHIPIHRKKQYSCPVCTRSYAEKYLVMKHIPQHFSSILHLCKICGKIYNAKNRLVQHLKIHSEVRNFKCSYCNKSFVKPDHLEQHLNIHTGLKPHQCSMCPKTFASYPNLHKHMRRMHNVNASKVSLEKTGEDRNRNKKDILNKEVKISEGNNNLIEDFVDSTSSEMETYTFMESDDSLVESDGIDPVAMEQESKLFEATNSRDGNVENGIPSLEHVDVSVPEFTDLLPEDTHAAIIAAVTSSLCDVSGLPAPAVPQEYGPDFCSSGTGFLDLDGHALPHIDPLLTIKPDMYVHEQYLQPDTNSIDKWEPIISKVFSGSYYETDSRMSVLNTDIF